jgi:hypothetical protein
MCAAGSALAVGYAQHHHDEEPAEPREHAEATSDPAEKLSPKLRALLNKEMALIADGMGELATAISMGEWSTVEKTATKIRDSFILKQQLGKEGAEELHAKLPEGFLRMDQQFHETSGRLAYVAEVQAADLAVFYYFRMLDDCVSCHAAYAPGRFPGLAAEKGSEHGH